MAYNKSKKISSLVRRYELFEIQLPIYVKEFCEELKVEIWSLGVARFSKPFFLRQVGAPGVGIFKTHFSCGNLQNGTRTFFANLKFPEFHVPSIRNELMLNETASNHDLPVPAERHLFPKQSLRCRGSYGVVEGP